ncbi:ANTAR domain-containing protein [Streptomyces sp. NPDC060011]|uniref:ANTAR domain-containing protein n=1 Tax=Streptomyces sp. NPDC060011 TaxID=3347037 RepID=UPI0036B7C49F
MAPSVPYRAAHTPWIPTASNMHRASRGSGMGGIATADPRNPHGAPTAHLAGANPLRARSTEHAAHARAAVDQALGILTARFHLPPDRGLDVLRTVSRYLDEQLPDVAADIVQWGLGHPLRPSVEEELRKLLD